VVLVGSAWDLWRIIHVVEKDQADRREAWAGGCFSELGKSTTTNDLPSGRWRKKGAAMLRKKRSSREVEKFWVK